MSPPPVLCHICDAEVHSTLGVMFPSLCSLISLHSYVEKLQSFIKSPRTWLQEPILPAIQLQDACKTSPVTMDKAELMWRLTFLKTVIAQAFEVEAIVIACSLNFL